MEHVRAARDQVVATLEPPVIIDVALCKGCGICIALCPRNVLEAGADGVPAVIRGDECTACRVCELHCPDLAIGMAGSAKAMPAADEESA